MRIYLKEAIDVLTVLESGRTQTTSYPSAGFYNAPEELAQSWIETDRAFKATDDNKVIAYLDAEPGEVLIDFDAGQKLAPEHRPRPPAPQPQEPAAAAAAPATAVEPAPAGAGEEVN